MAGLVSGACCRFVTVHEFEDSKQASAWLQTMPDVGMYKVPGLEFDKNYATAVLGARLNLWGLSSNIGMSTTTMQKRARDVSLFASFGGSRHATSITFISQAAFEAGVPEQLGLKKKIGVVKGCREVQKTDLIHNGYLPNIEVDPQNYQVKADGQLLWCEPADVLPMAQRYFLF